MSVRLFLFGAPAIEQGGTAVALPFERRSQLLVFLALRRGWVGRTEMASMLWPEKESKLAYTNLRKTLFHLQASAWAKGIESEGGALSLQADTDVAAFEAAAGARDAAVALPLRRGELLVGFDDPANESWTSWLGFERDRLRASWRSLALERLGAELEPSAGIELSMRLLEADPLDEAALRAQLQCLARDGQTGQAHHAYRAFAERLERELGIAPGVDLAAFHEGLGIAAAPREAAPTPTRPGPDDGFVGRTIELRHIGGLLTQPGCRLLCITGPGGVGKTRLARRVLQEFGPQFADGSHFASLEEVRSAQDVGARLAGELAVPLRDSAAPMEQVKAFLGGRHLLLALDNLEQIDGAAAPLEELLSACPRISIVATSRARLASSQEWLLPLDGLACPESLDQDHVDSFDAARMFIAAARRFEPSLQLPTEARAIVNICQRLGGLPLALELAAAWTRVLSCDEIAAELHRGTELLRATDAAHPARHASIEAVFDQSWRLLGEAERDALARLAVFRGGFTAEAARAVAGASLPVLGALADKSLLHKEGARLSLHPLVQKLAAEQLGDARVSARQAHARYFHRQLAQIRRALKDGNREALLWVDEELGNCRAAWRWAAGHGDAEAVKDSLGALEYYSHHRGWHEAGLALLRQASDSPAARADAVLRARLLAAVAQFEYRVNRYAQAESMAWQAFETARRARDANALERVSNVLGSLCLELGRYDESRAHFRRVWRSRAARGEPQVAARALDHLALVAKLQGHYDEALSLTLQALRLHRTLGDAAAEALCLNNLGALHIVTRELAAADSRLREALAVSEHHGLVGVRTIIFINLSETTVLRGELEAAADYARRGLALAEGSNNRMHAAWLMLRLLTIALRRQQLPEARGALADSLRLAITIHGTQLQVSGVIHFAELLAAQGEPQAARQLLAYAGAHPAASGPQRDEAQTLIAALPEHDAQLQAWPGIELEQLAQRIVDESPQHHAPLIAELHRSRGTPE